MSQPIFLIDLNHAQIAKYTLEDYKCKLENENAYPNKITLVSVNALLDKVQQLIDLDQDYYRVDVFK